MTAIPAILDEIFRHRKISLVFASGSHGAEAAPALFALRPPDVPAGCLRICWNEERMFGTRSNCCARQRASGHRFAKCFPKVGDRAAGKTSARKVGLYLGSANAGGYRGKEASGPLFCGGRLVGPNIARLRRRGMKRLCVPVKLSSRLYSTFLMLNFA